MVFLLIFSILLVIAVLISGYAQRSIVSTASLFLIAGLIIGSEYSDWVNLGMGDTATQVLAQVALVSILFTDGMRIGLDDLKQVWRLPARALFLGLPLTLLVFALLGYFLLNLTIGEALLLGAALSPTDPVFASALVGENAISLRLRQLLNVESGLNDGLALPLVIILLQIISAAPVDVLGLLVEIATGIAIGIGIPWLIHLVEAALPFSPSNLYKSLYGFSIGVLIYSLSLYFHGNVYLAAFTGGIMVVTLSEKARDAFQPFGEKISELLKLLVVLLFSILVFSQALPVRLNWRIYLFILLAVLIVRPVFVGLILLRTNLRGKEKFAAAWFGTRGFASVVYGLLILRSGIADARYLFFVTALVVTASILVSSSTDVVISRWLQQDQEEE